MAFRGLKHGIDRSCSQILGRMSLGVLEVYCTVSTSAFREILDDGGLAFRGIKHGIYSVVQPIFKNSLQMPKRSVDFSRRARRVGRVIRSNLDSPAKAPCACASCWACVRPCVRDSVLPSQRLAPVQHTHASYRSVVIGTPR